MAFGSESGALESLWGPLCAFGSSVTWAIGSSGYSKLSKNYSSFAVNFTRALVALPLFLLAAFFMSGGLAEGWASFQQVRISHWGWFTLSMVASYGLGDSLFLWSTRSLGVPGALAIASCYPIWTVMIGYFFANEQISWNRGLGILVTLTGLIIAILNGPRDETAKRQISTSGLLLALATSVAWATNSFATGRGGADLPLPVGNSIRMLMALILTVGFGRFLAPEGTICLPGRQIMSSMWLFVFEAFLGSCFYMYGMSHSPVALGSTLASLAPVVSIPVALVLGTEKFSFFRTVGVILSVTGIWLMLGSF